MDDKLQQEKIDALANEIDEFSKRYDYYGYCDAVEDFDVYWEQLTTDIYNGDVQYLLDWLEPIVEEEDEYSIEARELLGKLKNCMQ